MPSSIAVTGINSVTSMTLVAPEHRTIWIHRYFGRETISIILPSSSSGISALARA